MLSEIKLQDFIWRLNEQYEGYKISDMTDIRGFFLIYKNENLRYPQAFHDSQPFSEIFKIIKEQKVYYKSISEIQFLAIYNNMINEICETCQRNLNIIQDQGKLVDRVNMPQSCININGQNMKQYEVNNQSVSVTDLQWLGPIKLQQSYGQETFGSIFNTSEFVYAELYEDPNKQFIFHSDQLTTIQDIKSQVFIYKAINEQQLLQLYQNTLSNNCNKCKSQLRMPRNNFPPSIVSSKLDQDSNNNIFQSNKKSSIQICPRKIQQNNHDQADQIQDFDQLTHQYNCPILTSGHQQQIKFGLIIAKQENLQSSIPNQQECKSAFLDNRQDNLFPEYNQTNAQTKSSLKKSIIRPSQQVDNHPDDIDNKNKDNKSRLINNQLNPASQIYYDHDDLVQNMQQFESSISVSMVSQQESRLSQSFNISCTYCQNVCDEDICLLTCNHAFHIKCLKLNIQHQLSSMKCVLQCLCNQKIALKSLIMFDDVIITLFRNQLLTNQLRTIVQHNPQLIKKCPNNLCDYIYRINENENQPFKCQLCFI